MSFKETKSGGAKRLLSQADAAPAKPVTIIDFERSPVLELMPPSSRVKVLSGDKRPAPTKPVAGPKTPPEPAMMAAGTSPYSPNAFDPYDPTAFPPAGAGSRKRPYIALEPAQKTYQTADKVLALQQSTCNTTRAPTTALADIPLPGPSQPKSKLFIAKPSSVKSNPIKPMQQMAQTSQLPSFSPESPNSNDFGDLFEPPEPTTQRPPAKTSDEFTQHAPPEKIRDKIEVTVFMDRGNVIVLGQLPSFDVVDQMKTKFLEKVAHQERVAEVVRQALMPHYNRHHITKADYKHILRRAVPKVCRIDKKEINTVKIKALVEAYVQNIMIKNIGVSFMAHY